MRQYSKFQDLESLCIPRGLTRTLFSKKKQEEKNSEKRKGYQPSTPSRPWGSSLKVSNTGDLSHQLCVLLRIDKLVPVKPFFEKFLTKALLHGHQIFHPIDFATFFNQTATDGGCICFQKNGLRLFAAVSRRDKMDHL